MISIIGFAKTLKTLQLSPEKQIQYFTIIEQEGKTLSALVEEFLDISKIEAGTFYLNCAAGNINEIITTISDTIQLTLGKTITLQLDASLPSHFLDTIKIRNVLYNLIDNALKYGGRSTAITITTSVDSEKISASVHNTGTAIPVEEQERIFEKLFRGTHSKKQSVRGSGLGLAIAKVIVEGHGGRIRCESSPEKGTTFTFTIPIKSQCEKLNV